MSVNIRISKATHKGLVRFKGYLEMVKGRKVSLDEALRELLAKYVQMPVEVYIYDGGRSIEVPEVRVEAGGQEDRRKRAKR